MDADNPHAVIKLWKTLPQNRSISPALKPQVAGISWYHESNVPAAIPSGCEMALTWAEVFQNPQILIIMHKYWKCTMMSYHYEGTDPELHSL